MTVVRKHLRKNKRGKSIVHKHSRRIKRKHAMSLSTPELQRRINELNDKYYDVRFENEKNNRTSREEQELGYRLFEARDLLKMSEENDMKRFIDQSQNLPKAKGGSFIEVRDGAGKYRLVDKARLVSLIKENSLMNNREIKELIKDMDD